MRNEESQALEFMRQTLMPQPEPDVAVASGRRPYSIETNGNRVFGCDICQECCPLNRPAGLSKNPTLVESTELSFQPRNITVNSTVGGILELTKEEYGDAFRGSAVKRAQYAGLKRNAGVASAEALPVGILVMKTNA